MATTSGFPAEQERDYGFVTLPVPAAPGSAQPHLATYGSSTVLSWLEPGDHGTALRQAVFDGNAWHARPSVAEGDDWFVNWADFPSVTAIDDSLWAAHWLRRRTGGIYSYDIQVALSLDGGASWSPPLTPHQDNTATEHGFVSLFPWEGGVGAVWLDGRNTVSADGDHASHHDGEGGNGGMTLRAAHVGRDGKLTAEAVVDELVCDCCQTDVALVSTGPLVVYRNRTEDEVRDIHVARYIDGVWEQMGALGRRHWQIRGCPVNGPAIDAAGDRVAAVWYDGSNDLPRVEVAWSLDGGASFGESIVLDGISPLGRVDVVVLPQGGAVVSWMRTSQDGRSPISLQHVGEDGALGPRLDLVSTRAARRAGFPQLVRHGEQLLLAWTDVTADRVQSASISLSLMPRATTPDVTHQPVALSHRSTTSQPGPSTTQ